MLDVFHVSEHVHDCGKILFGEHGPRHQPWAEDQTLQLIEHDPVKYVQNLKDLLARQIRSEQIKAIRSLLGYPEANLDSLWYRPRLAAQRPIGTGLIEGGCKTIVTNRRKLNNARWTDRHAEQLAALRCLDYSGLWSDFWTERAA
ncbi:MAG: hypothetical protein ACXW2D_13675 [Burkholderiaceae bacterium]